MKNSLLRWLQWSTSCGKLRSKLLCIYFLLIVIPLGMFSLYAYLRVKSVIQEQTFSAAQNAFDDTCLSLEHLLGRLDGVIDILSTDSLIYTMASNDPRDFTYIRRLEDSDQLATTFEHLRVLSGVDRIRLYVGNDYPYSNTRTNIVQISRIEQSGWYQAAAQGRRRLWCAPADLGESSETGQPCFSSIQMVYNPRSVKEPLAILRADIDARRVQELVSGTSITENGLLLLFARGRGPARVRSGHSSLPSGHAGGAAARFLRGRMDDHTGQRHRLLCAVQGHRPVGLAHRQHPALP